MSIEKSIRERDAMNHYLEQLDAADEQDEVVFDASAVQAASAKLRRDPEPHLMRMGNGFAPLASKESSGLSRRMPRNRSQCTCCRSANLRRAYAAGMASQHLSSNTAAGTSSATSIFSVRSSMPAVWTTAGWRSTLPLPRRIARGSLSNSEGGHEDAAEQHQARKSL
jgi:hypothetical protein